MATRAIRPIRVEGNIAYVPLTQGYEAVIDAADVPLVAGQSWHSQIAKRRDGSVRSVYALGNAPRVHGKARQSIMMHRLIVGASEHVEVDHRDGDGLNNRRCNLREADKSKNQCNARRSAKNTSGFRGVSWHEPTGKWQASIKLRGRRSYLGIFSEKADAAKAYSDASAQLHGEFGRIA